MGREGGEQLNLHNHISIAMVTCMSTHAYPED